MRIRRWSAAAFVLLVSGAFVGLVGPGVRAADTTVRMVEGSPSDYKTWKFEPREITISAGSTVTWRNEGDLEHDARTETQEFSPLLSKGEQHKFTFTTPGRYEYYCEPHRALGMTAVINVTGGSTPSTAVTTTTTKTPSGGGSATTTTTRRGAQPTTTTATNGPSTTTTAPAETPAPTPEVTASSLPEASGDTTTTTTAGHGEEAAGGDEHGGEHGAGGAEEEKKTSPIGVAFAGISTVILAGISGKLLASRS